jgi:hypothetical protein
MANIIAFIGGCHDGRCVSIDSEDPNVAILAHSWYFAFTREGTIGKRPMLGSEAAIECIKHQKWRRAGAN